MDEVGIVLEGNFLFELEDVFVGGGVIIVVILDTVTD